MSGVGGVSVRSLIKESSSQMKYLRPGLEHTELCSTLASGGIGLSRSTHSSLPLGIPGSGLQTLSTVQPLYEACHTRQEGVGRWGCEIVKHPSAQHNHLLPASPSGDLAITRRYSDDTKLTYSTEFKSASRA